MRPGYFEERRLHPLFGMVISVALHVLVVVPVLWQSATMEAEALPTALQLLETVPLQSETLPEPQIESPGCLPPGRVYLGIGMQFDEHRVVITAPNYYPAYQAGVRLGDVVLNPDFEPGGDGYDHVELRRHGKNIRLRIQTQWICLQ